MTQMAGIEHEHIALFAVLDDGEPIPPELRELDVSVEAVRPFPGHVYCNKLQQLNRLRSRGFREYALLDTDVVVLGEFETNASGAQGKAVDFGNPPAPLLMYLFREAGLPWRPWETDIDGEATSWANSNGGVYLLDAPTLDVLSVAWPIWANWCLSRSYLFGTYAQHIDQVAFSLAVVSTQLEFTPLERRFNVPTHVRQHAGLDCDPVVLHYHRSVNADRTLRHVEGLERVNIAIDQVNRRWLARERLSSESPRDLEESMPPLADRSSDPSGQV